MIEVMTNPQHGRRIHIPSHNMPRAGGASSGSSSRNWRGHFSNPAISSAIKIVDTMLTGTITRFGGVIGGRGERYASAQLANVSHNTTGLLIFSLRCAIQSSPLLRQ